MNERARAWVGTAAFLVVAPGVVAVLVPWLISGWRMPDWGAAAWVVLPLAMLLIATGAGFLLHAFVRFAMQGVGTPAPVAPTKHLVVTGVYRYVRNPMYLAITAIILGQALLFGSLWMLVYLLFALPVMVLFVRLYEEPTLEKQFGEEYREYKRTVPGWMPRLTRR